MPGSATLVFNEPEDFEAALRAEGCLGLWITGRGQFRVRLTRVALHRLRLSTATEQVSRIAFIAVPADMVMMSFPIGAGSGPVYGAIEVGPGGIITVGPGQHVHARTDGPCRWGAIWVPVEVLVQYGRALTGAPFAVPSFTQYWRPPLAFGTDLRRLHEAATRMAETQPQALVDAEAAHGLEQQLIHAVVKCLSVGSEGVRNAAAHRHQDIMVGFERFLRTYPDRDVPMLELSAALGLSDRLLRAVCAEHLGMSGNRFLRLRRMSLVRRALRRESRDAASVSAVARRYGFSDLGRLAARYRAMFGELPSTTLRRRFDRQIVNFNLYPTSADE
jgi:AraC-like DNA-binding protein